MIQVIRVFSNNEKEDIKAYCVLNEAKKINGLSLEKVTSTKIYRLEGATTQQAELLAQKLLAENINQKYTINEPINSHLAGVASQHHLGGGRMDSPEVNVVEIAYKPGVMNPEVASIIKAAHNLKINLTAADSSWEYRFFGKLTKQDAINITHKLNLFNKTVEQIVETEPKTLIIKGAPGQTVVIPIRKMNDDQLLALSQDKLFLNLEEMKVIQNYFNKIRRGPTDCELETLAQTWSEHCAHKTFKAKLIVDGQEKLPLFTRLKNEALKHNKHIVSAFVDNSGVMDFYDELAICGKVETHNSPSAIEPYGGAATGSGGVFRDTMGTGLGAKTIASTDIFCFAPPDMDPNLLPPGCLPPDYLLKRVVTGVKDYGNRMGIPTNNGSVHFHCNFRAKPTVLVGAFGIILRKKAQKGRVKKGDLVVIVGGRTGRDGIHGATFSSGEMTDKTININSSAVQIGNAIEEKRMFDALLEARDKNLIRAIQDCGAGGFSSAIGEMGEKTGVTIHLEKAPLKYQGLSPWEIWISEAQERMTIAVAKKNLKKFLEVCQKYNVEATILGKFDSNKKLKVYFNKQLICNLDMKFLHHGLPQRRMIATKLFRHSEASTSKESFGHLRGVITEKEWICILQKVLSHPNVCSKEPIVRLYDHSVQGTNALQPFSGEHLDGPQDATILRPILNKPYGMVLSHGINPVLNSLDPYWGSIWAATEAISNYIAVGGNYRSASLINNYSWPFPDEESLWDLDKSVDGVVDFMKTLKIPVISGKDSLSSTYKERAPHMTKIIKIPPVLCISVFGKIPDVAKTSSSDLKKAGSVLCMVGKMDFESMGGSTYFDIFKTPRGWPASPASTRGVQRGEPQDSPEVNRVPHVDLKLLPKVLDAIHQGITKGSILSCHDISEGGLITALFEMCIGGNIGANINLTSDGGRLNPPAGGGSHDSSEVESLRTDYFLFNETAGCFVVEVENESIAKKLFKGISYAILGKTVKESIITVSQNSKKLFEADINLLKKSWQKPMSKIFR